MPAAPPALDPATLIAMPRRSVRRRRDEGCSDEHSRVDVGHTGGMSKLRLASASLIPPPEATEIDGLRRACGDGMLGRVDAHVTLVEPINVREELLDEVERIMRDAAAATPGPLTFTFGPCELLVPSAVAGALPRGRRRPRSAAAPRTAMRVGPFAREAAWPFVPHVTIGTDLSEERLDAAVAAVGSSRRRCRHSCACPAGAADRTRCAGGDRSWTPCSEVAQSRAGVASSSR